MTTGTILNHRYRIVELIGSGGMAHVYRAVNLTTHRSVAVKVLRQEYSDNPEFLRRFEREARAVLHLSHDNIVRAYGVGQYAGLPYIIMEYVEGKTLKQIIQENGPMPAKAAIGIVCQILEALSAAHAAGMIHRDVKPQNVILTKDGRAKLSDFGIARDVEASTVTFAGDTVIGSVHYLSPEQATGMPVTAASDIYSVGVMLYELLTGCVPFTGENSVAIALKHINDVPPEPVQLNPKIQPALNGIIMRALQKDADKRYPTARAMRNDLLHVQYDPSGSFLGPDTGTVTAVSETEPSPHTVHAAKWHGSVKIALVVALCICALLGTFFGTRSQPAMATRSIPMLTEKSVADATQKAEDYGFMLVVTDYATSDRIPYGSVLSQSPVAGAQAKPGTSISVVVSVGPDAPVVPRLVGLTYDDAYKLLQENGLNMGNVSYRISDEAIGYICEQTPAADTEVSHGQRVDVCISATSTTLMEMPTVTGLSLSEALETLDQKEFSRIFVRYTAQSDARAGNVIEQSPSALEFVQKDIPANLTVAGRAAERDYVSDIAYNLNVPKSGAQVMVTIVEAENGVLYERVLFEATLEKGDMVPVSFTATAQSEGLHELILYLDGKEMRRQETSFVARSA